MAAGADRKMFNKPKAAATERHRCDATLDDAFQLYNTGEDFWKVYEHCRMYNPILGHGLTSDVIAFKYKRTCEDRAVRRISKDNEAKTKLLAYELSLMGSINNHPNFMRVFGAYKDDCHLYMAMELGSFTVKHVFTLHFSKMNKRLHPDILNELTREVLHALCHLHHLGIAHRDLRLENIVCKSARSIVPVALINFDKPVVVEEGHPDTTDLNYASPESIRRQIDETISANILKMSTVNRTGPYECAPPPDFTQDTKVDIFAFGVCVFMLASNIAPLTNLRDACQFHRKPYQSCFECLNAILCAQQCGEIYTSMKYRYCHYGITIANLISMSLTFDAEHRPNAQELFCKSSFLQTSSQQHLAEACFRKANAPRQVSEICDTVDHPKKALEPKEQKLGSIPINRVASVIENLALQGTTQSRQSFTNL